MLYTVYVTLHLLVRDDADTGSNGGDVCVRGGGGKRRLPALTVEAERRGEKAGRYLPRRYGNANIRHQGGECHRATSGIAGM